MQSDPKLYIAICDESETTFIIESHLNMEDLESILGSFDISVEGELLEGTEPFVREYNLVHQWWCPIEGRQNKLCMPLTPAAQEAFQKRFGFIPKINPLPELPSEFEESFERFRSLKKEFEESWGDKTYTIWSFLQGNRLLSGVAKGVLNDLPTNLAMPQGISAENMGALLFATHADEPYVLLGTMTGENIGPVEWETWHWTHYFSPESLFSLWENMPPEIALTLLEDAHMAEEPDWLTWLEEEGPDLLQNIHQRIMAEKPTLLN